MKERVTIRGSEKVIEVRSDAGRLLYLKTGKGYELKCPRSKRIYVIPYEAMRQDAEKYGAGHIQ